jgi:hypothetical protein
VTKIIATFSGWTSDQRDAACEGLTSFSPDPDRGGGPAWLNAWDIEQLFNKDWANNPPYTPACTTPRDRCRDTVAVSGNCFYTGSANYVSFGTMWRLCRGHYTLTGPVRFSETTMLALIDAYKGPVPYIRNPSGNWIPSREWAKAGYRGWAGGSTPAGDRPACAVTCSVPYRGSAFTVYWFPNGWF